MCTRGLHYPFRHEQTRSNQGRAQNRSSRYHGIVRNGCPLRCFGFHSFFLSDWFHLEVVEACSSTKRRAHAPRVAWHTCRPENVLSLIISNHQTLLAPNTLFDFGAHAVGFKSTEVQKQSTTENGSLKNKQKPNKRKEWQYAPLPEGSFPTCS